MRGQGRAVAVAIATVLIGCGGEGAGSGGQGQTVPETSDQEQIVQTVEDLNVALADGDGATACALVVPRIRDALIEEAPPFDSPPTTCEEAVPRLNEAADANPELARAFKFARVENVVIRGNEAQAEVISADFSAPQRATLEKAGNRWLVVEIPGYGDLSAF